MSMNYKHDFNLSEDFVTKKRWENANKRKKHWYDYRYKFLFIKKCYIRTCFN